MFFSLVFGQAVGSFLCNDYINLNRNNIIDHSLENSGKPAPLWGVAYIISGILELVDYSIFSDNKTGSGDTAS